LEQLDICVLVHFVGKIWGGTWARVERHIQVVQGSFGTKRNFLGLMGVVHKLMGITVEEMVGKEQVFRAEICRGLVGHTFGTFCRGRCC
jgi:hypothetical protein